jgi:hypothetical protein
MCHTVSLRESLGDLQVQLKERGGRFVSVGLTTALRGITQSSPRKYVQVESVSRPVHFASLSCEPMELTNGQKALGRPPSTQRLQSRITRGCHPVQATTGDVQPPSLPAPHLVTTDDLSDEGNWGNG